MTSTAADDDDGNENDDDTGGPHLRKPVTIVVRDATLLGPGLHETHQVVLLNPSRVVGITEKTSVESDGGATS